MTGKVCRGVCSGLALAYFLWFCSDIIRSFSCFLHDWPSHSSPPSLKLLWYVWYFWFCSQLVSIIPFKPSTNHLSKRRSVGPSSVSFWNSSGFSTWAYFVCVVHSTTLSDITKPPHGSPAVCWWFSAPQILSANWRRPHYFKCSRLHIRHQRLDDWR